MGSIALDVLKVNSYVLPILSKSKTNISSAYNDSNSLKKLLPNSFSYKSYINEITNQIYNLKLEISNVESMISRKIERASSIENRSSSKSNSITSLASKIGEISGTIGGAVIGASTGGIVGAVAGGVIGNNVGKTIVDTGAKVVTGAKNIFSKVWEGIKKVGTKIVSGVKTAAKWCGEKVTAATNWVSNAFSNIKDWTCKSIDNTGAFISKAGTTIWGGLKSAWNWVTNGENWEKIGSTIIVGFTSVVSGLLKIIEHIADGIIWLGGTVAAGVTYPFSASTSKKIQEGTMNIIAYDVIGEANKSFYENTSLGKSINDNSWLKYDSKVAKGIQNVSTAVGEIALATAATVLTGGVAAPLLVGTLGFANAAGETAEAKFQDKDNRDFWKDSGMIAINGAAGAIEWIAKGKMGAGAVQMAGAIKNIGLKTVIKTAIKSFSPKNIISKGFLKNTLITTFTDSDTYFDSFGVIADNTAKAIDTGKFDWKQAGIEFMSALGTNIAFSGFQSMFGVDLSINEKIDVDDINIKKAIPELESGRVNIQKQLDLENALNINIEEYNELLSVKNSSEYGEFLENSKLGYAQQLRPEYYNLDSKLDALNIDINRINSELIEIKAINNPIQQLDYNKQSLVSDVKSRIQSNFQKMVYTDTSKVNGINEKILNQGLYHFTSSSDEILDSGHIKSSGLVSSYGNKKSFFFAGIPDAGAYVSNLDNLPLKTTAIKVDADIDLINSKKLKVRNMDDFAVTYDGKFDLNGKQASKQYFCLVEENNKLVYKNVTEEFFKNYDNTVDGKRVANYISDKNNIKAIKSDFYNEITMKSTNAKSMSNTQSLIDSDYNLSNKSKFTPNIKGKILAKVPKQLDSLEKSKYLYNSINEELAYSEKYFFATDKSVKSQIANTNMKLSNMTDNKVVCSNWADMYCELLNEQGISASVRGTSHKWVALELEDGSKWLADGTQPYNGATDLINSKTGVNSGGFFRVDDNAYISNDFLQTNKNRSCNDIMSDLLLINKQNSFNPNLVGQIDTKLGYNYTKVEKLFSDSVNQFNNVEQQLLKINSFDKSDILQAKFEKVLLPEIEKLDTMEGVGYFHELKKCLSLEEQQLIKFRSIPNSDSYSVVFEIKKSDGTTLEYLFDGKSKIKKIN